MADVPVEIPKDYRLELKVRNNRILRRIEDAGYTGMPQFSRNTGYAYSILADFVRMSRPAMRANGEWVTQAQQLADLLQCNPEDLFNARQAAAAFDKTKTITEVDVPTLESIKHLALAPPDSDYERKDFVTKLVACLTNKRQIEVLTKRYGLDGDVPMTYEEIAKEFGITKERIRQIEMKALRTLKHPKRLNALGWYGDAEDIAKRDAKEFADRAVERERYRELYGEVP